MPKLAIVATIMVSPEQRDEYVQALRAHAARCRATEPGTLQFEILLPENSAGTVMLYELYASQEAFQYHLNGESIKQVRRDTPGIRTTLSGTRCELLE